MKLIIVENHTYRYRFPPLLHAHVFSPPKHSKFMYRSAAKVHKQHWVSLDSHTWALLNINVPNCQYSSNEQLVLSIWNKFISCGLVNMVNMKTCALPNVPKIDRAPVSRAHVCGDGYLFPWIRACLWNSGTRWKPRSEDNHVSWKWKALDWKLNLSITIDHCQLEHRLNIKFAMVPCDSDWKWPSFWGGLNSETR